MCGTEGVECGEDLRRQHDPRTSAVCYGGRPGTGSVVLLGGVSGVCTGPGVMEVGVVGGGPAHFSMTACRERTCDLV
jgi:hypothetical protein